MIKSRELAGFSQGEKRQRQVQAREGKAAREAGYWFMLLRGGGISIPIEIQNLIIHGPEQTALNGHPVSKRTVLDNW